MQLQQQLMSDERKSYQFLFGPVKDETEITEIKDKYLGHKERKQAKKSYG
ncbi:MAG: cellobionic acid phosphorylase [Colwellia sp.]|jgi:cellobionic acid phosphorylase